MVYFLCKKKHKLINHARHMFEIKEKKGARLIFFLFLFQAKDLENIKTNLSGC